MMRSLIDSDAIVTRRQRSRFRLLGYLVPLPFLVGLLLALVVVNSGESRPPDDEPNYGPIGPVGPADESELEPLNNQDQEEDDDADNEIASGELALARLLAARGVASLRRGQSYGEVYLLEDKDYPSSVFENPAAQRLGQVSGIAASQNQGGIVLLHRANRHWDASTFNESTREVPREKQEQLIDQDTIMVMDRDGQPLKSFGANLLYMPHSVASDPRGNLWVSDVARHQVMRLPAVNIERVNSTDKSGGGGVGQGPQPTQIWPDIILGEAFVPGADASHFCQPAEIAVSSSGEFVYVADGYCNGRVMVFSGSSGNLVSQFGQQEGIRVVHSLALIEEKNILCVADRENQRILCYNAGLDSGGARMGELIDQIQYPIGRVFAITSVSPDHLLVSSNQPGTSRYDLAILNPFTHELKLVWTSSDLLEPHSLATTPDRQYAYAADLSKDAYKKVFKFHVIQRKY